MSSEAIYLYCFLRPGGAADTAVSGVCDRPVLRVDCGHIGAVYSIVATDDFSSQAAGNRMDDAQWVIACACRHEQVIEEAMLDGPVVPVRFGTVFSSLDALRQLMTDRSDAVAGILNTLGDKQEWAVKGFVDAAQARQWLIGADPTLAEASRCLPESPGARYFQEKRLDTAADAALGRWQAVVAEDVRQKFLPCTVAVTLLDLQDRRVSGRDGDMVVNLALLVDRDRVFEMRARARTVAAAYADAGLTLDVTGPWPPYNFCSPLPLIPEG
jgi:hypothetical protein